MLNELIYRCMGNLKYFSLLMAAGMFAACSDNLENAGNGNEGDTLTGEKGYVNIGINLPTTNGSSRVPYSDNFDDGEESEYKVNEVIIALFYGANEASATCKHAFQISGDQFIKSSPATDNITTYSVSGVRMISDPDPDQKVYALALINAPSDIFQVTTPTNKSDEDAGNSVLTSKLQFRSTDLGTFADVTTLSGITAVAAKKITSIVGGAGGTKYYFMSNAPLAVSSESSYSTQTLAPITVYKDKKEAAAGAAFNPIYVERAAAKVVVNIKDGVSNDNTLTIDGTKYPHYDGAKVKFTNWTLQNTNKTFLPIRKVNDFSTWYGFTVGKNARFISTGDISGNSGKRRIYWAMDDNYTKNNDEINSNIFDNLKPVPTTAIGAYEYCPENTTTAGNMTDDKLTSVLLKSTFTPKGATAESNFFMIGDIDAVYSETEFVDWATKVLAKSGDAGVPLGSSEKITLNGSLPTTGTVATDKAGLLKLLNIPIDTGTDGIQEKRINALLTAANSSIKFYKGGVTYYYATAIKHFGDDETPAPADGVTYNESDHLGRFGVVRNTWYEITINSVSGPGEPTIPEIPTTPPDKKQSYINCEINVLSWAKRSQGVDL